MEAVAFLVLHEKYPLATFDYAVAETHVAVISEMLGEEVSIKEVPFANSAEAGAVISTKIAIDKFSKN